MNETLTELEKEIKKIIYDNSPCSMNDAASAIASLIDTEREKAFEAGRDQKDTMLFGKMDIIQIYKYTDYQDYINKKV